MRVKTAFIVISCCCYLYRLHSCYFYASCWLQSVCRRVSKESFDNLDYEACWKR